MNIKQILHKNCQDQVNDKLAKLENTLIQIQESLESETKSSAGDKHETGRAMIHLEREQLGSQLSIIEKEKEILKRINSNVDNEIISLGSWVKTSQLNYFISIGLGKITIEPSEFYAISVDSPIAQLLLGKRVGDKVFFRNQEILINETH